MTPCKPKKLLIFLILFTILFNFGPKTTYGQKKKTSSAPKFEILETVTSVKYNILKGIKTFLDEGKYDSAIIRLKKLELKYPEQREFIEKEIKILSEPPKKIEIVNLGKGVNSEYSEYFPVVTLDDQTLYFTARDRAGGFGGEDIWFSRKKNGFWSEAINLGPPLNTSQHEALVNISPDSSLAFIYGNYPNSMGNGDIFISKYTNNGWSDVENIGAPINSKYYESDAYLSSDGRTLFFASDRPGVIGEFRPKSDFRHPYYNTDIFVSIKTDTGWSDPINLGPTINTNACERGPLFHPDGQTLFFCSSGHPGLGDLDIFVSYKIGERWTDWTEPINLGKEINTSGKDWGYSIPLSGDKVYFSSVRKEGYGKSDIYLIKLNTKLTKPITVVRGKVTDQNGKPIEDVLITWEDLQTFKILGITHTKSDGRYTIILPSGKWYSYTATKDSFIFASKDIDLRDKKIPEVQNDLQLPSQNPDDLAISSALLNVFFELNQSTLKPESKSELDRFLRLLQAHPEWIKIEIGGHTCDLGSREYNRELSFRRAQSVVKYLVDHGIAEDRLIAKGYGFDKPKVYGFTEEARKKNRRVEFRVIKLDKSKIENPNQE